MAAIDDVLAALDERRVAQEVGLPHDEARLRFRLERNTVDAFDEFTATITDYYRHHFRVTMGGAELPRVRAAGLAKQAIEHAYRERQGDLVAAFNDAHDGTNGGLRALLDAIADALKAEAVQFYVRDVFDRHVAPNDWDTKVAIIRQFIAQCGANLASSINADQPERYAQDYQDLIQSYVDSLRHTSSIFRRL